MHDVDRVVRMYIDDEYICLTCLRETKEEKDLPNALSGRLKLESAWWG